MRFDQCFKDLFIYLNNIQLFLLHVEFEVALESKLNWAKIWSKEMSGKPLFMKW